MPQKTQQSKRDKSLKLKKTTRKESKAAALELAEFLYDIFAKSKDDGGIEKDA
jgi:hypothetical protein